MVAVVVAQNRGWVALLGLSMLPDGSTGFATTCNTLSNYCGVFKYVPAAVA